MRVSNWFLACATLLLFLAPAAKSQDKPAADASIPVSVKLQVILSEYDGQKKISTLPYTIPSVLTDKFSSTSLRVGVRVPVNTSSKNGESSVTYIDIGTNLDCRANRVADGRFNVDLKVDRSSLYVAFRDKDGNIQGKEWVSGDRPPSDQPMIQQFRGDVGLLLRDGQGSESTVATDPVTGRVLKIEAVLNVLK
jgi:hypothetical protein